MKIIITMQLPYVPALGGANKCNRMVAEALVKKSHDVQVIVPATNEANAGTLNHFRDQLAAQGIQVQSKSGVDLFHLKGVEVHALHEQAQVRSHLIRQIKTFKPDWVLVSGEEWSQGLLEAALKALPSRVVYLAHTVLFLPFGPVAFFPSQQRALLLEQVAGILACSRFVKAYIQEWSGIESSVFHFPAYGSGPFPNTGCFDKGFVTLINPSLGKGISIFLELARKFPDVQFGCVPTWGTTQNDRVELERIPNIIYLEPSEDIDRIFAQTRVLVLPSLWPEGFTLTSVEAMLRGIPVLASNSGGLPEAKLGTDFVLPVKPIEEFTENLDDRLIPIPVIPEQTGDDIDQWCHALENLLSDRTYYERQSFIARRTAQDFVSDLGVGPLEDFLNNLASQPPKSPSHSEICMAAQDLASVEKEPNNLSNQLAGLTPEQQALLSQWLQNPSSAQQNEKGQRNLSSLEQDSDTSSSVSSLPQILQLRDQPVSVDPKWSEVNEQNRGRESSTKALPLVPVVRKNSFPLSFAQQRLWFLDQWEPNSPAYLLPYAWRLKGPLDIQALRASFEKLVARHEILRTSFSLVEDQPVQVITETGPVVVPLVDLTEQPEPIRTAECQRRIQDEANQAFDLQASSQLRAQLLRLGREDHVLLVTLHHILTDGWSMGIFWQELSALYAAERTGHIAALPALPIQYVDFAVWQRQCLQGEVLAQQVHYWQKQLVGLTPLALPTDTPRPAQQTYRGDSLTLTLKPTVVQGLTALSQQEGVTLFMTLLAAYQVVLARYTGQEDIAVGLAITNRPKTELEGLIGFFVNTLVLRTQVTGILSFRQLLHQVRETCLEAYAHQDMPFEKLVEVLHPVRDPSRHPLIQTMFQVYHADETAPFTLPNLEVAPLHSMNQTAKFDLQVGFTIRGETMTGHVAFNTDLFTQTTMERFGRHFQRILDEVVRDPAQRLWQISLLDEAERQQQLLDWNDTATAYPKEQSLAQLFEAQVAKCPDAIAVVCGKEQLTYTQLNQRANQLAHYLQRQGVGPEVRVGVCLERGLDLIASLLAILKAGGAYVPFDPGYPKERLAYMLTDAHPAVLLTQQSLLEALPSYEGTLVCLDTAWPSLTQESPSSLRHTGTPDTLAYVIYTSGSTGRPKGVMISHRGLGNIGIEQQRIFGVGPASRVLQFASSSFDASVFEMVMAWQAGATLCMAQNAILLPGEPLLHFLREQAITVATLPPSALATMTPESLPGLATLTVAGEACPASAIKQWGAGREFFNLYGPTEGTIWSTMAQCPANLSVPPPIGRPIANTQGYVVNQAMQLVPVRVSGELIIGGIGIALGYHHRPDLTAEKFVPHPFSQARGARVYRTGDRARYRSDGNLEFLGRSDHQVKLRGYRIELGEIEAVLTQHPHVQEVVILCREDKPGDKRVVAYVVPAEEPLSLSDLRQFLKQTLPEYMVPASFVMLDALPLTPSGKLDRRALPAPAGADRTQDSTFVAPRTPLEQTLAGIWREVLGLEQVGVHDNFFELGGHSLLATQVASRVRKQLRVELKLTTFFEGPTVTGIAKAVEPLSNVISEMKTLPLVPCYRETAFPLSFAQQRLWFLHQLEPTNTAYLMSSAFHLRGPLVLKALEASLQSLVNRHDALRTTFPLVQDEPVQQIAPAWPVPLPVIDLQPLLAEARQHEVKRLIDEDAHQPFDLAAGPLFRFRVLTLGADEHLLLLTLHHIISDGWSMGIFYRELQTAYTAFCAGQEPSLPELPIQYADYAVRQRTWLQGKQLDRQLGYWREQLAEVPTLTLPTDFPRPAIQDYRGEQVTLQVSPAITEGLKAVSRQAGATLFMTMLAAFQLVLQRWSGQDEVCVGIPSAGRTRQEIEQVMGFFINTLVVRTDISGQPTFIELLEQVRKKCLGAYAHQDVPFEKLVEELHPARQLNRNPFFDVLLNFVGAMETTFELPEVTIKKLSHSGLESKFALTLYVTERENGIYCKLAYQTALFRAERMQALVAQYHQVLEEVVAAPEQSIQSYSLVTDENRAWLPDPRARLEAPPQDSVLICIRQWARRTPDQVAVRHGSETLRYGELLSRSQTCAQALRRQGLIQDNVVAIRGPRSSGLIVAVVGVWLAGGIILLLDPRLPPVRQRVMREAGGAQFLVEIGSEEEYESGPDKPLVPCLFVNPSTGVVDSSGCVEDEGESSLPSVPVEGPAYVFFTSGTTGVPKGILGSHQALAHFLGWQRDTFAMSPLDRVAQCTGVSFDVILRDFFLPLTSGATVCLPPEEAGGRAHLAWLAAEQITVVHVVPSVASFWVSPVSEPIGLPSLRWVFFAGEPLTDQLLTQWEGACPGPAQFVNLYGATETTLVKSWYLVPQKRVKGVQPVGQPLPQTQLLVMGENHRLCGIGEVGELVIRTPFRSLGYLHTNDDTPPRFVPNPYREDPTDVLYHTGDLGRYRLDGTVEILGRRDEQVKIRGVRVEPQEVMAVLSTCPEVQMCTVLASRDTHDEIALTAFVVPQPDSSLSGSAMRAYLSARIPSTLVPSQYVRLAQFPLTPNGKIDRQALRSLTPTEVTNEAYVAPRTPLEETVAAIWQEVLKVDQMGIHDNFFDLGGHSLLATRVVSRVRQEFHVDVKLMDFFKMPTIAELTKSLEGLLWVNTGKPSEDEAELQAREEGIV